MELLIQYSVESRIQDEASPDLGSRIWNQEYTAIPDFVNEDISSIIAKRLTLSSVLTVQYIITSVAIILSSAWFCTESMSPTARPIWKMNATQITVSKDSKVPVSKSIGWSASEQGKSVI